MPLGAGQPGQTPYQVIVPDGWKGTLGTKYFLARDRKGVITSPAVMLAYFVLANLAIFELYRTFFDPGHQFNYTLLSSNWATWMFTGNFVFLFWRLANRSPSLGGVALGSYLFIMHLARCTKGGIRGHILQFNN